MKKIDIRLIVISLLFILAAIVIFSISQFTSQQANKLTTSSKAATSANQQCNINPTDKCTQGVLGESKCQFKSDWNSFTISGNPRIGYTNYPNMGSDPRSVKIEPGDGKPFSAGVYLTFNTTPGKTYCASWRWGPNTNNDQSKNAFGRTIGLDPSGGTNPQSGQVVWGNTWTKTGRILDYDLNKDPGDANVDVKVTAQSNTMTIFLRADYNAKENSFLLIDMVNVYDEGTSNPVPTNTPVPPTSTPQPTTPPPTATPQPNQPTATATPQPPTATLRPNQPTPTTRPGTTNQPTVPPGQPTNTIPPADPNATWTPVPTWTPAPTWTGMPGNPYDPQPTESSPFSLPWFGRNDPNPSDPQQVSEPIEIKSPKELAREVVNPESVQKLDQATEKPLTKAKEGFDTVKKYDRQLESYFEGWIFRIRVWMSQVLR